MLAQSKYVTTVTKPNQTNEQPLTKFEETVVLEFDGTNLSTGIRTVKATLDTEIDYIRSIKLVGIYVENVSPAGEPFRILFDPNLTKMSHSTPGTNNTNQNFFVLPGTTSFDVRLPLSYYKDGTGRFREVTMRVEDGVTFDRVIMWLKIQTII